MGRISLSSPQLCEPAHDQFWPGPSATVCLKSSLIDTRLVGTHWRPAGSCSSGLRRALLNFLKRCEPFVTAPGCLQPAKEPRGSGMCTVSFIARCPGQPQTSSLIYLLLHHHHHIMKHCYLQCNLEADGQRDRKRASAKTGDEDPL